MLLPASGLDVQRMPQSMPSRPSAPATRPASQVHSGLQGRQVLVCHGKTLQFPLPFLKSFPRCKILAGKHLKEL